MESSLLRDFQVGFRRSGASRFTGHIYSAWKDRKVVLIVGLDINGLPISRLAAARCSWKN